MSDYVISELEKWSDEELETSLQRATTERDIRMNWIEHIEAELSKRNEQEKK